MKPLFFVTAMVCFSGIQSHPAAKPLELMTDEEAINGTIRLGSISVDSSSHVGSDIADNYWAAGLSPTANAKRFKAIRAGLLINLNESVSDLNEAIKSKDVKEVQYHLRKLNEKWNRLENLQKTIIQLIPDDNLDILVEESRLFEDNRDAVDRHRELASEFLLKTVQLNHKKTSRSFHASTS